MKAQIFSKKKLIALSAAAMAIAIPAAMFGGTHSFASASEENGISLMSEESGISPQLTLDSPTCLQGEQFLTAVQLCYQGDSAKTSYMQLGQNPNPSYGYKKTAENIYNLVAIPNEGANGVTSPYYWGKSILESGVSPNITYYESNIDYFTSIYGRSQFGVTGRIVNGSLTTSPKTLTYDKSYSSLFITIVYAGEAYSDYLSPNGKNYVNKTIQGVEFHIYAYNDRITVSSSRTVQCNWFSGEDSSYAAFSYYGM